MPLGKAGIHVLPPAIGKQKSRLDSLASLGEEKL